MNAAMLPMPPATGAAAAIQGAIAAACQDICPPRENPVAPTRLASTSGSDCRTRAACTASSTPSPMRVRPHGSRHFASRSFASRVLLASVPRTVTARARKPRRASSRDQPLSGPRCWNCRSSVGWANCCASPLVPGMQTMAGAPPACAAGAPEAAGRISTQGTSSPSRLAKVSSVSSSPSSVRSLAPRRCATLSAAGTASIPRTSRKRSRTNASSTGAGWAAAAWRAAGFTYLRRVRCHSGCRHRCRSRRERLCRPRERHGWLIAVPSHLHQKAGTGPGCQTHVAGGAADGLWPAVVDLDALDGVLSVPPGL